MTAPPSVGGIVVDGSALAAMTADSAAALSWLAIAHRQPLTVWIPELALIEVETIRPHTMPALDRLRRDPLIVVEALSTSDAGQVDELLHDAGVWDVLAAIVVHQARRRGWRTVTADPGRLLRLDPDIPVHTI